MTNSQLLSQATLLLNSKRKQPIIDFISKHNFNILKQHNTYVNAYDTKLSLSAIKEQLQLLIDGIVNNILNNKKGQ